MRVQEVIEAVKNGTLMEVVEVKTYIPVELKCAIADSIIYDSIEVVDGCAKIDSFARYMSYMRNMIISHTNIEYEDSDYDVMCETKVDNTKLIDVIIGMFEEDAQECTRILDMKTASYMQDYTMESVIARALNNIGKIAENFGERVINEKKDLIPDSIDMDQLAELLKTLNK